MHSYYTHEVLRNTRKCFWTTSGRVFVNLPRNYKMHGSVRDYVESFTASNHNIGEDRAWEVFAQILCILYSRYYGEDPPALSHPSKKKNSEKMRSNDSSQRNILLTPDNSKPCYMH
jgi:hypothetical protein